MMRAISVLAAGTWDDAGAIDTVLLEFDFRHRRRLMLRTEAGADLLLDLSHTARLRDGDGLALDTEGAVRVRAKPEPLLQIHAHDDGALVRIAWHLGNRHLPVQLLPERIRIRPDNVIAEMVQGLGGHIEPIEAAFDPETGAYAPGHHHGHDDDHTH